MKKTLLCLLVVVSALLFQSCNTAFKNLTDTTENKNVSASGYTSIFKLKTGFDPVTGTPLPEALFVVGNVSYKSNVMGVPDSYRVPDSADYESIESASIWNASAKTKTVRFSFTASSPDVAKHILKQIVDLATQNTDSEALQ